MDGLRGAMGLYEICLGLRGFGGVFLVVWLRVNILQLMRINGTKYETIDSLPKNAINVRQYADANKMAVGHVYMKYERYLQGSKNIPGYEIRCFQGMNFVIPANSHV